jgi:tetratricopeptide (TPR) repeat protein
MNEARNEHAKRQYETARTLHRAGNLVEAERLYVAIGREFPNHPGVLHGLGAIALRNGRIEQASRALLAARQAAPNDAAIAVDLGRAWLALARFEDAAAAFRAALAQRPDDRAALIGLGDACSIMGRLDEASEAFGRLLARDSGDAAAHFGLGTVAMQRGRTAEARAAFERASASVPDNATYLRALADAAPFVDGDPRLPALEALARKADTMSDDRQVELGFALFKAYDELGRYPEAFAALSRANAIRRRHAPYDEAAVAQSFEAIKETFTAPMLAARGGAGHTSSLPVFVVGMPRSGSTLVEQILASHPAVFGAGELTLIPDMIAKDVGGIAELTDAALETLGRMYCAALAAMAPSARRVVDKLPANFRHLGLIHLAMPGARIVHVRRDPMDTGFSCYSKLFLNGLNYTYDLGEIGRYYRLYDAMMAHWRAALPPGAMIEIDYETLVDDLEAQARRIVAFCGLEWDARCLAFHETDRPVRTLSRTQVRTPLFKTGIGRWRRYEAELAPLRDALRSRPSAR